ncbi:MAG: hypothetical protein HS113_01485 [Verrucomicrobiales bacterium]|nr:hypothetical protein [Verrucomicrobiales bacterium]
MDIELLIQTFPHAYHMAHVDAWECIPRHGLLSTSALLDLFAVTEAQRYAIECTRRSECIVLEHPAHGRVVVRDNKPMDDQGLARALKGITPREWYQLLNGMVFFWLTEQRLTTLLSARAYRTAEHCIITVNTRLLMERHAERVWLCPMNSGATKPMPHPRSRDVFQRVRDYPFDYWRRKKGGATRAVAELAVDHSVPDIMDLVERVAIHNRSGLVREVWHR